MTQQNQTVLTTCPYCGVGCGMQVSVPSKSAPADALADYQVQLIGDKQHPANLGRLCVKGSSAGETVNFEGRMLAPQINGQEVDWSTALNEVASRFQKVIAEHGPQSVAFYVSGQLLTEDYYVANKLIKGFLGSANIDTNSRLCMASAVVGYKRAFGADSVPCSYEDLEQAELITLVGSNAAWAHPIVYQRIAAAKKANPNMKVVVVDPRKTATCDIADLHLPLKPGTDAVLFNGLLAYLANNQAVDQSFIEQHTEGFGEALAIARQLQGDLSSVAAQCDLQQEELAQFYQWVMRTEKMVTLYSQGVNQSSSGVDKSNAIINCHLATATLGKPGCGPFSITGQPNAMGGREVGGLANQLAAHMDFSKPENIDRVARFWQAQNMAQSEGLKAVDMFKAVADGRIKAIWIMNTNPVVSMPDADAVRRALQLCDTVVVSDCMQHTDTTDVGDILLPALTWGETTGSVTNSDRTISIQRQFMQGPKNARADWWMICEVAKRMGYQQAFDYANTAQIFNEHAQLSAFENGMAEDEQLRDFNLSALIDMSESEYRALKPIQWPVIERDAHNKPIGSKRLFSDAQFFTANRKAQFIAIKPQAPLSVVSDSFPFVLNTGRIRDQWHTMTRTAKTARLMAHRDQPYLSMHPDDAERLGCEQGGLVKASNDLGKFIGRVDISDGQRKGEVFAPMHWTAQYASDARVDALVAANVDALSGQPESKHAVVKIEPFVSRWQALIFSRTELDMQGLKKALLKKQQLSNQKLSTQTTDFYWVKVKGRGFYRYELSCDQALAYQLADWQSILTTEQQSDCSWLEYEDNSQQQSRLACVQNGAVEQLIFVCAQQPTTGSNQLFAGINRDWLAGLFELSDLSDSERRCLLAGKQSGAKDVGKIVCSCFGVGINTIVEAIQSEKLLSAEDIGAALKAGTNCGSCLPELKEILTQAVELVD
ncbi:nitrate reductase [Thiomicrorhabdus sediminis]|uniref:Nitrate reductase n=1 Tax=Thiomicrorhabdus sediminis TaxID=2580412 RepID=A0A4P9K5H4_9GAMM|nr:nitrate reductase [Thiomicrorhabdus sediminis]QCU90232.1 nitrate reductase [Thiomicrorhabdus sediminis]